MQQIFGTIMYYARAINLTTLVTLSTIASEQAQATEHVKEYVNKLLNYLHIHKDTTIQYVASNMVLNIHSDGSYLSRPKACSRLGD